MEITFRENEIEIHWIFKDIKETKSWDWIKGFQEVNSIYYFDLDVWSKNVIMIRKGIFSEVENETLHGWLQKNRKIIIS